MPRSAALLPLLAIAFTVAGGREPAFQSRWRTSPDRDWAGPEYWANRLQDWRVRDGRLQCIGRGPLRTLHLLTHRLGRRYADFRLSVRLGWMQELDIDPGGRNAGFLIGSGPGLDYRAAALIHHTVGPRAGIYAGIDGDGRPFMRDLENPLRVSTAQEALGAFDSVTLMLSGRAQGDAYFLEVGARRDGSADSVGVGWMLSDTLRALVRPGSIGLVCNPTDRTPGGVWFRDWTGDGLRLDPYPSRTAGPVIGSQHTLSRGTLKLTAQLMPVAPGDARQVELQVREGFSWTTVARAPIVLPGYTATFELDDWDDTRDIDYQLAYTLNAADGSSTTHFSRGTVGRDPVDEREIVVAAFTGNHNVAHPGIDRAGQFDWRTDVWFPHADIVDHARDHDPDLLFFSGDQVYETASPTAADRERPFLDYLYKWYLWHWAFRELTAEIPTVTIPDDHDVYQGNLWGAGGVATPEGLAGTAAQDAGGYRMSPEFVNMVQRTQTSHLPDPYDPRPVARGIDVYYTDLLYGGLSFAVLEDRKWKSPPGPLLPEARIQNGWPRDPEFDPKIEADVPAAALLGDRQLEFLEEWATDWSGGAWMKVVLSQTLLADVATLPEGATSDAVIPSLAILEPGEYAESDRPAADFDSNGWPQSGRDAALRAMRKAFAVHIAGDGHLASTIQYGIDEWGDAGYAMCVPSIANFWPRRWYPPADAAVRRDPGALPYAGDFEDGFGNKITVHAVANPQRFGIEPERLHDRAPGYGIVRFGRESREISFAAWPRWADPAAGDGPYDGWPVTFAQPANYGAEPIGYLPRLEISGMTDPVVQVIDEASNAIVYTLRIEGTSYAPQVFREGRHTVRVGELGGRRVRTITGLQPAPGPGSVRPVNF